MMGIIGKWLKVGGIAILVGMLLILPAIGLAQEDQDEDEAPPVCNPVALRLADEMRVDCPMLLGLQAQGYGLGQIMKAWYMFENLEGFDGDWQSLLARKQEEGLGWGQFKMAHRLAGEGGDPEAMLALKQSGLGWGQIKKAQALADAGLLDFNEAVQMMADGLGWGEIQAQLELPPGPPPWAGGPKNQGDQGPPPWANNDGDKADKDKGDQGPPPWANNDKDKNKNDG